MSINLNLKIQKKDLWLLAAIMVFLVGVGYVIAYGSGNPAVHGHDTGEIALPSCATGEVIIKTATGWGCGSGGGSCSFGDWVNVTDAASNGAVQGPAATDGFVFAHGNGGHCGGGIYGYTDSTTNPSTIRSTGGSGYIDVGGGGSVEMAVKKGDYWKIGKSGCLNVRSVYWVPLNCGGGGGGTLQCVQKSLTGGNFNGQTLYCDEGYIVTGGGCGWRSDGNDFFVYSLPNGNGWYCRDYDYPAVNQIWAICCKVE